MELLHGAPADMTGRSDREKRAYAFLDKLGIEYDRTDHPDRTATTMEVCAEVDAIPGIYICKKYYDVFDDYYHGGDAGAMTDLFTDYGNEHLDAYLETLA